MGMSSARIAALCGVVLGLCIAAPAQAADRFHGIFTTNLNTPPAQVDAELDRQAATGAGVLREHVYWDQVERKPGAFDFSTVDALVARASARGLTLLPIITSTPQFYSTRPAGLHNDGWPPRDASSVFRFSLELARRYGALGTFWRCLAPGLHCQRPYRPIAAWQVWNEPDLPGWWRTGVDPAGYLRLLQWSYLGLKAGDPTTEVVLGGLSLRALLPGGYLEQLYDLGAALFFDTLAIHPYAVNVATVVAHIRRTRQIAAAKHDAGVALRITEYGFATGGASAWTTTAPCQAALIAATARELSARRAELGLRSIVQLQWQDRAGSPSPWPNHSGLLYADGTPKPALAAFTDAVRGRLPAPGAQVADVCAAQHQG